MRHAEKVLEKAASNFDRSLIPMSLKRKTLSREWPNKQSLLLHLFEWAFSFPITRTGRLATVSIESVF